jgi:hypothetical protein
MKLWKKLAPVFALAAAVTFSGCTPPATTNGPDVSSPTAVTQTAPAQRETGFHYGVHVGPHINMSNGQLEMISIGPGFDF